MHPTVAISRSDCSKVKPAREKTKFEKELINPAA